MNVIIGLRSLQRKMPSAWLKLHSCQTIQYAKWESTRTTPAPFHKRTKKHRWATFHIHTSEFRHLLHKFNEYINERLFKQPNLGSISHVQQVSSPWSNYSLQIDEICCCMLISQTSIFWIIFGWSHKNCNGQTNKWNE